MSYYFASTLAMLDTCTSKKDLEKIFLNKELIEKKIFITV